MTDLFVRLDWNAEENEYSLLFRAAMNERNETIVWLPEHEARALFQELAIEFTPRRKQEAT